MSSPIIVTFHPKHLEVMDVREVEKFGSFKLEDLYERVDKINKESVQSATFIYEGRILFCAGFSMMWPGVAEGWMIPSVYVKEYPVLCCKILKMYVDRIMVDFKCHRFQTTSPDDPFHERWMGFLGLKKEGTMRQYTHDKKNYCVYARYSDG